MHRFKRPLRSRVREARYLRERYARDPEFRLRLVNRMRERTGRPPYASAEEIPTYSELSRARAAKRSRNSDGTFA